jgi:hypothetical protein
MIDEDELWAMRVQRVRTYEYVSRMRIAVNPAPTKDLRTEKVDHRSHDPFRASFERPRITIDVRRWENAGPPEWCRRFRRRVCFATRIRIWCHEFDKTLSVSEAYAPNPLRGEHPFCRIFRVNFGYVHSVRQGGILCDELGRADGIL